MFILSKKLKLKIPNGWHEIPFNMGLKLMQSPEMSDIEVMALITGVSERTIREQTDYKTVKQLLAAFTYLKELPNPNHPELPKVVDLNGEKYLIPFIVYQDKYDFGNLPVGAIEDIKAHIKNNTTEESTQLDVIKLYPVIVAILLQATKEYDYNKAMELSQDTDKLDFKTVYNIGNFFLMRLNALTVGSNQSLKNRSTLMMKLKRVYWTWIQLLASILP